MKRYLLILGIFTFTLSMSACSSSNPHWVQNNNNNYKKMKHSKKTRRGCKKNKRTVSTLEMQQR